VLAACKARSFGDPARWTVADPKICEILEKNKQEKIQQFLTKN